MAKQDGWEKIRQKRLQSEQHKKTIEYLRQYHKEQYQTRKANGICVRCGVNLAAKGRVMCAECLLERNQLYGGALAVKDKVFDDTNGKRLYYKMKREKRCPQCFKPLTDMRYVYCEECREYKRRLNKRAN